MGDIRERLANVTEGIESIPWGDETIRVHYVITKNDVIFGRASDIMCAMIGERIKDKKVLISKYIKKCNLNIGNNLQEATLQVVYC